MPQSTGADVDSQDKKFISKISETVSAEYSKEMLFWIVNENGSNNEICDAYCNKIKAEDAKISEKIIVNCRDKKAVEDKLLKPILTKMKDRIRYVDEIIVKKANDFGTAVFNEYSTLASEINNLFVGCASEDLQTEMLPRIRDAYETELLNGIRELCLGKYAELREEECEPLYEAIDNTLKNIFDFIPDKDVIIERYVRRGSNDAHESLRMCNNIARLGIIDSFNKLDIVLNDIVKGMKREVVEIMANKAFLCKITPYGGNNDDPDEWINTDDNCSTKYCNFAFEFDENDFNSYSEYRSFIKNPQQISERVNSFLIPDNSVADYAVKINAEQFKNLMNEVNKNNSSVVDADEKNFST